VRYNGNVDRNSRVETSFNRIARIASRGIVIIAINHHVQASQDRIAHIGSTLACIITTVTIINMVTSNRRSTEVTSTVIVIVTECSNINRLIHASELAIAIIRGTFIAIVADNRGV